MTELTYTRHAERRAQQRGIPPSIVAAVLLYADIEMPLAGGRTALRLSANATIGVEREISPTLAEQIKQVVLIVDGAVLVTVLHAWGQPSRRYRRRRGPTTPEAA